MFRLVVLFAALQATTLAFQPLLAAKTARCYPVSLSPYHDDDVEESLTTNRRAFLGSFLAILVAGAARPSFAEEEAAAPLDYKAVAADVADLVKKNPDWGPTLVRLAWHSSGTCKSCQWYLADLTESLFSHDMIFSFVYFVVLCAPPRWFLLVFTGTYDKMSKTGGSGGGTIRFAEELAHGGNAGLAKTAVEWLEPLKAKYKDISYADLYTLAGVSAIKTMGGPTIPWSSGRVDAMDPSAVTPDGRLPNADSGEKGADKADSAHLRDIFYRMGTFGILGALVFVAFLRLSNLLPFVVERRFQRRGDCLLVGSSCFGSLPPDSQW